MTDAANWRPGMPLYRPQYVSYSYTPVPSDPCPPGCWHYAQGGGGGNSGMRWTEICPALRFLPDGLHVSGGPLQLFDETPIITIVRGVA
jgi:hypothetical protein